MKTLLLSLFALVASVGAQAAGPNLNDPCAPIARLMDSRMYCDAGKGVSAEVVFTTYASANSACVDRVELSFATVTLTKGGKDSQAIKLSSGEFETGYDNQTNESWLTSNKAKLKLRRCVHPAMGGVSIGN
jgi:hypothetical protein